MFKANLEFVDESCAECGAQLQTPDLERYYCPSCDAIRRPARVGDDDDRDDDHDIPFFDGEE